MVPAPEYPPLVPDYSVPTLAVVGLVAAVVAMVVFVWFCLGAPRVVRRLNRFPAVLLVVAYSADRSARADHEELTAAWEAQSREVEERAVAAVEDQYGVEVVQHWFVPDEGSDRVEIRMSDGRVVDDCTLVASGGVLTLECPGGL
jgi:hypothetical protein